MAAEGPPPVTLTDTLPFYTLPLEGTVEGTLVVGVRFEGVGEGDGACFLVIQRELLESYPGGGAVGLPLDKQSVVFEVEPPVVPLDGDVPLPLRQPILHLFVARGGSLE